MKLICAERFRGVPIRRMTLHNCDAIEDGLTPDGQHEGDRSRRNEAWLGNDDNDFDLVYFLLLATLN